MFHIVKYHHPLVGRFQLTDVFNLVKNVKCLEHLTNLYFHHSTSSLTT